MSFQFYIKDGRERTLFFQEEHSILGAQDRLGSHCITSLFALGYGTCNEVRLGIDNVFSFGLKSHETEI